jgi:hypothetical protein
LPHFYPIIRYNFQEWGAKRLFMVRVKQACLFSAEKQELYRTSLVFKRVLLRSFFASPSHLRGLERTNSEQIANKERRNSEEEADLVRTWSNEKVIDWFKYF